MNRASAVDSAKLLKQTLQRRFPATKFSVRLSRGTGYGDCHVLWTDGPTPQLVEQVTTRFEGQTFDGMTDMREYRKVLMPDGQGSGLNLILTQRVISHVLACKAAAQVAAFYGLEMPQITPLYDGASWRLEDDGHFVRDDIREFWSTLIYRAAGNASIYQHGAAR